MTDKKIKEDKIIEILRNFCAPDTLLSTLKRHANSIIEAAVINGIKDTPRGRPLTPKKRKEALSDLKRDASKLKKRLDNLNGEAWLDLCWCWPINEDQNIPQGDALDRLPAALGELITAADESRDMRRVEETNKQKKLAPPEITEETMSAYKDLTGKEPTPHRGKKGGDAYEMLSQIFNTLGFNNASAENQIKKYLKKFSGVLRRK